MTIRLYADLKKIPLDRVAVLRHDKIHARTARNARRGKARSITEREIKLEGDVGRATRKTVRIADKCPVHRTLTSEIDIRTRERAAA
jgi:putative redox protein